MRLQRSSRHLPGIVLSIAVTGCSLFRPEIQVEDVWMAKADQVADCVEIATSEVSLMPGTMESYSADEDLAGKLEMLARESAVQIGGNTIVPRSEIDNRSQLFTVYSCKRAGR